MLIKCENKKRFTPALKHSLSIYIYLSAVSYLVLEISTVEMSAFSPVCQAQKGRTQNTDLDKGGYTSVKNNQAEVKNSRINSPVKLHANTLLIVYNKY